MNLRRLSLWLSISGGVALMAAATFLVSVGWGELSSTTATADGTVVTETHRSPSAMETSPSVAVRWLLAVLALSVVAVLLIRFGGPLGRASVVGVAGLGTLASIMSIGLLIAPGAALLTVAAVLAEVDRSEHRREGRRGIG